MSSKRLFTWSKRQSGAEPYYRTGGLLPIDMIDVDTSGSDSSNTLESKDHPNSKRQRPLNLTIIPPDSDQFVHHAHPRSSPRNAGLASSSSNLFAIFNDMLRSPALGATADPQPAFVHNPPPTRPRSVSLPSSPGPIELPGSILQDNQGYPESHAPALSATSHPVSYNAQQEIQPPDRQVEEDDDPTYLLELLPRPLNHAKSVPSLVSQYSTMRSAPNGTRAASSGTAPMSNPIKMRRESRTSAVSERTGRRDDFGASQSPTPATAAARSKQIGELKTTVTIQDGTISKLRAQLSSLQASHESHAAIVADTHAAEVASLKNRASLLEQQLAERPTLRHAPSNNLLFLLDTPELPQTPDRESSHEIAPTYTASKRSSRPVLEKQQRSSFRRSLTSSDMESLKRKLTNTRRPEPVTRNLLPELNQHKQNNVALQTQIGSLMAKLNESRKSEKALKISLQEVEQKCLEWEDKASKAEKLAKNTEALQNSIDHLEHRLEMANAERLDAQEEVFNLRMHKSPFDVKATLRSQGQSTAQKVVLPMPGPDAHTSTSTVFSTDSPSDSQRETEEPTTLSGFIAHIERLQGQLREKDLHISELHADREYLRQRHGELEQERDGANLELEIQNSLMGRTQQMDRYVEQLRTAIIDREAIIGEKERLMCAIEKQLEHHKLLLQAEIRKHGAMLRHNYIKQEPLPELGTLATKKDIDRWMQKLNQRLKSEKPVNEANRPMGAVEGQLQDLQDEVEFYVREIIYYKLDIRGYKSDIRKLKKATGHGNKASDLESDTSSLRPTTATSYTRYPSPTPELGTLHVLSPGSVSSGRSGRPITPLQMPPPGSTITPGHSPLDSTKPAKDYFGHEYEQRVPMTPQSMGRNSISNSADDTEGITPKTSPRFAKPVSPERRKPVPSSPDHGKFGALFTSFPLNSPVIPQGRDNRRSMSESVIQFHAAPATPERASSAQESTPAGATHVRGRSVSDLESDKTRYAPERPLRPQYGLFESPATDLTMVSVSTKATNDPSNRLKTMDRLSIDSDVTDIATAYAKLAPTPKGAVKSTPLPPLPVLVTRAPSQSSSTGPTSSTSKPNRQAKLSSPPEHQPSEPSDSSVPFVMAMGAPHNPALFVAAKNMPPTVRQSAQRRAPMTSAPTTMRTGVGGTMASSPSVVVPPNRTQDSQPFPNASFSTNAAHTRTMSLPFKENMAPNTRRLPAHSRNASTSSLRTAIRLPKGRGKEVETHRIQKGSISKPMPMERPFDIDRSVANTPAPAEGDGSTGRKVERVATEGDGLGIGEAI